MASSEPLDADETVFVAGLLRGPEKRLFGEQPSADQRHAYRAARYVVLASPERSDLVRAALLHDVGKRHSRLGILGRVVASLLRQLRLEGRGRVALYLEHPAIGGAELEEAGAEPLVVEFALNHHGRRPATIHPDDWAVLLAADHTTGGLFAD